MSKIRNKWLALAALAAGTFLLAALPLAAQEETATGTEAAEPTAEQTQEQSTPAEDKGFTFTVDPISFGVLESDVNSESSKWEEYRDLGSGFLIPILAVEGRGADDRFLDFRAENVRRDDARYT